MRQACPRCAAREVKWVVPPHRALSRSRLPLLGEPPNRHFRCSGAGTWIPNERIGSYSVSLPSACADAQTAPVAHIPELRRRGRSLGMGLDTAREHRGLHRRGRAGGRLRGPARLLRRDDEPLPHPGVAATSPGRRGLLRRSAVLPLARSRAHQGNHSSGIVCHAVGRRRSLLGSTKEPT
jgi:hypothetical protein